MLIQEFLWADRDASTMIYTNERDINTNIREMNKTI